MRIKGIALRALGCLILSAAHAAQVGGELPMETWRTIKDSVAKADGACGARKFRLALARLDSVLLPQGIGVAAPGDGELHEILVVAVQSWRDATGGDVPFRVVSPAKAEIVVKRVDSLPARGPDALGLIDLSRNMRWNGAMHQASASGTISIVWSHEGERLSRHETFHVLMHELGHLVGLDDTSASDRLMGPMRRGAPLAGPSVQEATAVMRLRENLRARVAKVRDYLREDPGVP